jgi:hypothetical protein
MEGIPFGAKFAMVKVKSFVILAMEVDSVPIVIAVVVFV